MRRLIWFTVGFAMACSICAWAWDARGLLFIAGILGITSLAVLIGVRPTGWGQRVALILLGVSLGLGWFEGYFRLTLDGAAALDGETVEVFARCDDYGDSGDSGMYGTVVDAAVYLEGEKYRTRLYLKDWVDVEPGDYISGSFRFRLTTPGGMQDTTYHQGEGIFLLGYQRGDMELTENRQIPWQLYPARLRHQITQLLDTLIPSDTSAFAKALLIGNREGMDYETTTVFKSSGIMHVIAVSGLHVSILFSLIYTLALRNRWIVALLGLPALVLFAAVAGFTPSVSRACIMQGLMILAMIFDRQYDGPAELSFATLVMLICNPLVITSISFQLSVGCVAGIFAFHGRIYFWLNQVLGGGKKSLWARAKGWLAGSVSMTLSSMSLITPLAAYHFGAVSLIGVVTNVLTLWAVTFIFCGLIGVCILGSFWTAGGVFLAEGVSWLIRYVLGAAKLLARFPLAVVYTRSVYIICWLVLVYVLLVIFFFSSHRRPVRLLYSGVLGLCVAVSFSWLEPMSDGFRVNVLDVEQGQSIIIQSAGETYLVDCGGRYDQIAADLAAETLMSRGIFRLDGVIVTGYDRAHTGGLPNFLTRIQTDALYLPQGEVPEELVHENIVFVPEKRNLICGAGELTLFDNERGLSVLFRDENYAILINDAPNIRLEEISRLDVLVGAYDDPEVRPGILVITAGDLSDRQREYDCPVFRTELNGEIIFRR